MGVTRGKIPTLCLSYLAVYALLVVSVGAQWHRQYLGSTAAGQHTGLAVYDLNYDGYPDILISAGRHSRDQSVAHINLGFDKDSGEFRFSRALKLGPAGGYYNVDVAPLSSLEKGHVAVLLAGGSCNDYAACGFGNSPAVLLDVLVSGCSMDNPYTPCYLRYEKIWTEPEATGNRNGVLSTALSGEKDPCIVLVGLGCVTIFHPDKNGNYGYSPDYVLHAEDKVTGEYDTINRGAGLAVGKIGDQIGVAVGPRSRSDGPAPVVCITKTGDKTYEHWQARVEGGHATQYAGNWNIAVQATGIVLADFNADGYTDMAKVCVLKLVMLYGFTSYTSTANSISSTIMYYFLFFCTNTDKLRS